MTHFKTFVRRYIVKTLGAVVLSASLIAPTAAHARVFLSVGVAPPVIPVYEQPLCPGEGYIWTPGYWAYGDQGYFWVDGAWVEAPYEGALWTPGYWGFNDGAYLWNAGYWGPEVGYYGGINYGFGYFGTGFYGGYWNGGRFFYNGVYNHLDIGRIHNIYNGPYRGGSPVHPGGRSFDPHPQSLENRASNFNSTRSGDPRMGNTRTNGFNSGEGSRPGADATQGFRQNGVAPTQGVHNLSYPAASGQYQGTSHGVAVYGGSLNSNRPQYDTPQRSYGQPNSQPGSRSYTQPPQQRSYSAPAAPQQRFSAPAAAPQQHFSAPSSGASQGGSSHGSGGGRR